MRRTVILVDLDNCIADDAWRRPFIDLTKDRDQRYHRYHILSTRDDFCNAHILKTSHEIVIVTGRPRRYHDHTVRWLDNHKIVPLEILMRSDIDHSPAAQLKANLVIEYLLQTDNIIKHAYDDRQDVIDIYKAMGLKATRMAIHQEEVPIGH